MWNLIWWFDDLHTNRQINIHQYEFSLYYKLLMLYHFVKLKFVKCYFEVNSSNLFPINISGYMVRSYLLIFLIKCAFKSLLDSYLSDSRFILYKHVLIGFTGCAFTCINYHNLKNSKIIGKLWFSNIFNEIFKITEITMISIKSINFETSYTNLENDWPLDLLIHIV